MRDCDDEEHDEILVCSVVRHFRKMGRLWRCLGGGRSHHIGGTNPPLAAAAACHLDPHLMQTCIYLFIYIIF